MIWRRSAWRISTTLARAIMVKDERNLDKFDRAFKGLLRGPRLP